MSLSVTAGPSKQCWPMLYSCILFLIWDGIACDEPSGARPRSTTRLSPHNGWRWLSAQWVWDKLSFKLAQNNITTKPFILSKLKHSKRSPHFSFVAVYCHTDRCTCPTSCNNLKTNIVCKSTLSWLRSIRLSPIERPSGLAFITLLSSTRSYTSIDTFTRYFRSFVSEQTKSERSGTYPELRQSRISRPTTVRRKTFRHQQAVRNQLDASNRHYRNGGWSSYENHLHQRPATRPHSSSHHSSRRCNAFARFMCVGLSRQKCAKHHHSQLSQPYP